MKRNHYLHGEQVYLRAVEPEDLEFLYKLENDPDLWNVGNFIVPYSRYAIKQFIEQTKNDLFADTQLRLMIVRTADDTVMGVADLCNFQPKHSHAEVGIALQQGFCGAGHGREALHLLCHYAFGFLNLHQLTAHVLVDNTVSRHLFTSCGFVECGLLRQWASVGDRYEDVVLMQRLNAPIS
ncbi:MAG: GNAT family N-acetyltransferase [Prevotellaceae bacterium]|jgi:diamine N-acetyltransferase|nr:GNAT family N-acetyltransferase [Prevotellaceae bacterium]